jgi:hypothetical protein
MDDEMLYMQMFEFEKENEEENKEDNQPPAQQAASQQQPEIEKIKHCIHGKHCKKQFDCKDHHSKGHYNWFKKHPPKPCYHGVRCRKKLNCSFYHPEADKREWEQ